MTLENSPHSGEPSKHLSLSQWISQNRWAVLALMGVALVVGLVAIALQVRSVQPSSPPGGLDGCLVTSEGAPLVTTVRIGKVTRPTYENGCFFFPSVPPGTQQLVVTTPSGEVTLAVTIVSNEAANLGTLPISTGK